LQYIASYKEYNAEFIFYVFSMKKILKEIAATLKSFFYDYFKCGFYVVNLSTEGVLTLKFRGSLRTLLHQYIV